MKHAMKHAIQRIACLIALSALAACSSESTAPAVQEPASTSAVDLIQQFGATSAAAMDRGGIGGSEFPADLKLTAEQKAKIQALHDAFQKNHESDLTALKAVEQEVKAAVAAGKSRADIAAIITKAQPIMLRLAAAFAQLQRDVWAIYTPAQQAWITAKGRGEAACRPDVISQLTADQITKIRSLKAAFGEAVKGDLETIRKVNEEARAAKQGGASREEVAKILAKADAAMTALAAAEKRLASAILDVLTPAQKANACLVRALIGR